MSQRPARGRAIDEVALAKTAHLLAPTEGQQRSTEALFAVQALMRGNPIRPEGDPTGQEPQNKAVKPGSPEWLQVTQRTTKEN